MCLPINTLTFLLLNHDEEIHCAPQKPLICDLTTGVLVNSYTKALSLRHYCDVVKWKKRNKPKNGDMKDLFLQYTILYKSRDLIWKYLRLSNEMIKSEI